jgi:hypothetical protein
MRLILSQYKFKNCFQGANVIVQWQKYEKIENVNFMIQFISIEFPELMPYDSLDIL